MKWRDLWSVVLIVSLSVACGALTGDYYGDEYNSLYSPTDRTVVTVADNRKPAFRDCKGYAPSVKEEQSPGTFVLKVEADDPDEADTIEYSFVTAASERPKFRIDSKTGVIVTAYTFDRDEPIREKEVYVTVRATDNGRPALDDVCTFKVTIEDINDNPPVFDKAKYEEGMSEDTQANRVVMRISASDFDDGDNSIVKYELLPEKDYQYFRIDENNGLIYLARSIDKKPGQYYSMNVRAYNVINDFPQDAQIEVRIRVIESNKRPPTFINPPTEPIYLKENFSDYSKSLVVLKAQSNVPDKPEVIFELITGRTEQTNSKKTFVFTQGEDDVSITLGKALDYEAITDYTLTMSVKNTHDLVAEHLIKIKVEDVNDNIPYFTEVTTGTISENEPPGTPVMQVRAFDMDGTAANNIVSFELADNMDIFAIDSSTGNITALTTFDREERDFYNVKVIATDNSPSSLYNTGQHNMGQQVFRIEIADKNDHRPHFTRDEYISDKVAEDANINFLVIEVTAEDADAASQITYTIVSGNIGEAFKIDPSTGKITVNNTLDYENITEYSLRIRAFDGVYEDNAIVTIKIENVNDNPPKFLEDSYRTTIPEETIVEGCILNIEAFDPDIKDRNSQQFIKYFIVKSEQQHLLAIDNDGCLRLIQPLDRDEPNGHKNWQVIVAAVDENGSGLRSVTDVTITLTDINDNAPFLNVKMPVIWPENRQPGNIVTLKAKDYDEVHNGPPFHYEIDPNALEDIKMKFGISGDILIAMDIFDREEQKEYMIPILISDSGQPTMRNVSILHVVIGDENDNPMKEGSSSIFVYNYKGESPDTEIGRVYVNDPDDWDLPDKFFSWKDGIRDDSFSLNADTGMITMLEGTREGDYRLFFSVTEESRDIPRHSVIAEVTVTVREIPEEAVDKSGSIRFYGVTAEEFIVQPTDGSAGGKSHKDRFRDALARTLNVSVDNVDVFTVLKHDYNASYLDVRYSAHGSPYYPPEKLNGLVGQNQEKLEEELGLKMFMINIDECLIEKNKCEASCTNVLHKSNVPLLVYTNQTSFVGVNAFVQAECVCRVQVPVVCLNGGTPFDDSCECPEGYEGPHCEVIAIGFHGNGYAMYPPINPCDTTNISLELSPHREDGLVLYVGPLNYNRLLPVQDFLALELVHGYPVLIVDYGSGSIRIEHKHIQLKPGKSYTIDINMQQTSIEMTVDNCRLSTCMSLGAPQGPNEFLNVNAPLQLGGISVNLEFLASQFRWQHVPQSLGYSGCVRNLTIDGKTYNIGAPSISKDVDIGCQRSMAVAVAFGIDTNFLIAILVCIAVLLFLILAVVVHKRHQDGWHEKDMDDIRETIINYEDEGGGERDTDYDLNVFRVPQIYEDKPYKESLQQRENLNEVPDIGGFLVDKKDSCDKDNDAHPVDDVRYYAYEGDGNSTGSLSSLASCTDDGDLKFDYLSNFGPRFRKLADMYGEEPSDTDSNGDAEEGWRI
uniref:Cadherin egf lag seven-pass g-type receptor n=1 Tax=Phlebotomus kandelakii TaxID=1109342 RepID=A0A6B2EJU5_9DIPT